MTFFTFKTNFFVMSGSDCTFCSYFLCVVFLQSTVLSRHFHVCSVLAVYNHVHPLPPLVPLPVFLVPFLTVLSPLATSLARLSLLYATVSTPIGGSASSPVTSSPVSAESVSLPGHPAVRPECRPARPPDCPGPAAARRSSL